MPTPEENIYELAAIHWQRQTWQDRPDWYWFYRLVLEILELSASLLGVHRHTPEHELLEIGSMCINWMWKRSQDV
jgi:hypothetical protein